MFDLTMADVIFNGIPSSDWSAHFVSSAADVNGDGLDDLLIGAANRNNWAGETYLIYGRAGIAGDFDKDGDVDGDDLLVWQWGGSPVSLSPEDLAVWKANFGTAASAVSSASVPEPSAALMLTLGMTTMLLCRVNDDRQDAYPTC